MSASLARQPHRIQTAGLLFLASAGFTLWQNTRVAVLWDISFLLDTSYRWSIGQLPYKTLPFPHAPLTFLLHTGIIKLFGRVYYPHILCVAIESGAATVLTWLILLAILKPLAKRSWLVATLLAAPLTILGIYSIYPHPIYDGDCCLAVLFALYLLQRAASRSRQAARSPLRDLATGAACVVPVFFKQNIGLPFLLVVLASVGAVVFVRLRRRITIAPQLWLLAGAISAFVIALILIQVVVGLHNYLYWTITFAAQRRLPGLSVIFGIYHQASLLWRISAAIAALILLRNARLRNIRWSSPTAIVLLAAPFLWIAASLALTNDPEDRASQLLSLWPHLLLLAAALAIYNLRCFLPGSDNVRPSTVSTIAPFLPLIALAAIHGTLLSQQLWGSTYAIWPLLMILIASLLVKVPAVARPISAIVAATLLLCGSLYATSYNRLDYIYLDGQLAHATLPQLQGLATRGPWIPGFEELVRFTNAEIPADDGILLIPGEDPFYFTTGRVPKFPILLFDPTTDPYTPQQTLAEARACNIRWLVVNRTTQLTGPPHPALPEIINTLQQDFALYRSVANYDIYRPR